MLNVQPIEDKDKNSDYDIPFDGFVNVNDIVKKRRNLREANFTCNENSDPTFDEDLDKN